jgi:GT2 family glycosyltransferase
MRLITVGIPVFNAMPYLPESLDSILRQRYSDFEVLIVNDGSNDGSSDYLHTARDPRVRIVDQENRGLTATLNRMLDEVNTPWLARHDADDVAYPDRLRRTSECINQHPEAGMFYSLADYYPAPSLGKYRTTKGTPAELRKIVESGYLLTICHPTVTLNVARAKAVGGYRFNLHVEDVDLWWRMALDYDINFIPEVLTGYRQTHEGLSANNLEQQAINTLYIQYLLVSHLWNRQPLELQQVRTLLLNGFSRTKLEFRAYLRAANIELGRGNTSKALVKAVRAFFTSPSDFTSRLRDECSVRRAVTAGGSPTLFKKHEQALWPDNGHCPRHGCQSGTVLSGSTSQLLGSRLKLGSGSAP